MVGKLARLLACWHANFKNWHVFGALARQIEKLAPLFSTLALSLACWHVQMKFWHVAT